jgi:hypothetical protein
MTRFTNLEDHREAPMTTRFNRCSRTPSRRTWRSAAGHDAIHVRDRGIGEAIRHPLSPRLAT